METTEFHVVYDGRGRKLAQAVKTDLELYAMNGNIFVGVCQTRNCGKNKGEEPLRLADNLQWVLREDEKPFRRQQCRPGLKYKGNRCQEGLLLSRTWPSEAKALETKVTGQTGLHSETIPQRLKGQGELSSRKVISYYMN